MTLYFHNLAVSASSVAPPKDPKVTAGTHRNAADATADWIAV